MPRKPSATTRRREIQLTLRISEAEYEAFKRKADEVEQTLTTWIRLLCRERAGLPTT